MIVNPFFVHRINEPDCLRWLVAWSATASGDLGIAGVVGVSEKA